MKTHATPEGRARAEAEAVLERIRALGPMLKASVTRRRFRCGKPGCACARGRLHRDLVATRKVRGKTQTIRVRSGHEAEALAWLENWRKLKTLLDRLAGLQFEVLRPSAGRRADRRRPGHSRKRTHPEAPSRKRRVQN